MQEKYKPEEYWTSRAKKSQGDLLEAVCVDKVPKIENRSAESLQITLMKASLVTAGLKPGARVLEYGCGGGRWCGFFEGRGYEWHGVDISADMLKLASRRCDESRLSKTDGSTIPHGNAEFDLVYSITVLHHNSYENQEKIVAEMVRVLKPGGILIMYEDISVGAESFNMFPRTVEGWITVAQSAGVTVLDHKEVRYWPFRSLLYKALRRPVSEANRDSVTRKLIGWVDYRLGGIVQSFIPKEKKHATSIVFKKGAL